ncbi:E3 ubiquitin-protein ligase RNF4-like isoform X1 [Juglans microcarpa x Juglans regia]|uniref:E3 ubiquitin-protein ligase RNF4-like isoform X1 n=2 Tax=Juglans microcarpa x Juglans regia TaxID=2249226 RepID=UPI001B7DF91A|nr:E3 ubiquitin-protein ligase RNF4-like isoform X1 [Juglans microcarpa x Juglans regia]XP_041002022.1 E3 ubiquitin-protein ligase RNF4-like isoform X1 [Juglans microcarpa x Juglans regia]
MSTQAARGAPARGNRQRKMVLDLDLNMAPPNENQDLEGPSTQVEHNGTQTGPQGRSAPPPLIDVEAIDDDVVESSPRAFAQARNRSRRNGGRLVVDVDLETRTRVVAQNNRDRRRALPRQTIFNCDLYINLESSSNNTRENVTKPPLPPKEPTLTCPICMGPVVEEMSTRCGHIFCKACITTAMRTQSKCPTCRKPITINELIRIFLPSSS